MRVRLPAALAFALVAACGYPPLPALIGDAATDDAGPIDGTCFGTGLVKVCLAAAPTMPLTIADATTIDTGDPSMCAATRSGADHDCVIAATVITVNATLRATGARPLVLIARDAIAVNQLIDVGSHRGNPEFVGAGADDPAFCMAGTPPGPRAGGGAGGSFTGRGGTGGTASSTLGSGSGGQPADGNVSVSELHGGCRGQDGTGAGKGTGGHGGGAVYLIAGNRIDITGPGIMAAGEGGAAGQPVSGGPGADGAGAGGGGSGGMIGFDAPSIAGASLILANGGGGGEGCGTLNMGVPGADPTGTAAAPGGGGGSQAGGDGGSGSSGAAAGPGTDGRHGTTIGGNDGGGGGGGGGAGLIKAPPGVLDGNVSPAATP